MSSTVLPFNVHLFVSTQAAWLSIYFCSVAPIWVTWSRTHCWKDREEKKPRDSNPLPLHHEACTLPLCYNCRPTDVLLETLYLRLTLRLYNHQLEGPDWNSPIASRQQQNQSSCQQHLQFPSSLFPMLLNSSVRMRAGVSNMLDLMAMNLRATMDKCSWNWQKYQILLHNKNNIKQ